MTITCYKDGIVTRFTY